MAHPEIENHTPFAFEPLFTADEEMRPIVVTVVKATYVFDAEGIVQLADEQLPVNLAGEPATDAPVSSYKYEPEIALHKPATDIALIGHVQPPGRGATQIDVGIKVGGVQKLARVFGDRYWTWTRNGVELSSTAPVERIPLIWEHAFGGVDAAASSTDRSSIEPRNPVGTGFGKPLTRAGDQLRLPNIEDPNDPIRKYGDVVAPCGFGFTSPNWQPRAAFAGTYDEQWNQIRKPLIPVDFDRRFFNAAAPGLVAPGYLRCDEDVVVLNATRVPRLTFRLPAVPPPTCRVTLRSHEPLQLRTNLDTVIVNTDDNLLVLLWRSNGQIGSGPHDVKAIEVFSAN